MILTRARSAMYFTVARPIKRPNRSRVGSTSSPQKRNETKARLTILILILQKPTQLPHTHPRERLSGLTIVEHPSGDARPYALVQEGDGGRRGDEVGDGREQFTDQAGFVRG